MDNKSYVGIAPSAQVVEINATSYGDISYYLFIIDIVDLCQSLTGFSFNGNGILINIIIIIKSSAFVDLTIKEELI